MPRSLIGMCDSNVACLKPCRLQVDWEDRTSSVLGGNGGIGYMYINLVYCFRIHQIIGETPYDSTTMSSLFEQIRNLLGACIK